MEITKVILYAGKGGIGKTTIAAANVCRSAELGHRTLVPSTDATHFLVDSFSTSLGNRPQLIAPNLMAQESSTPQTFNAYWGTTQKWMADLSCVLDYYNNK
jgi:arsenite-transporting ATPase